MSYLILDVEKNELQYTCCEESSLWVRDKEEFKLISLKNPPLGQLEEAPYEVITLPIDQDQLILTLGDPQEVPALLTRLFQTDEKNRETPFTLISISKKNMT